MRRTLLLGLLAAVLVAIYLRRRRAQRRLAGDGDAGAASVGAATGLMPVGASVEVLDPVPQVEEGLDAGSSEGVDSGEAAAVRRSMLDDPLSWAVILFVALVVATLSIAFLLVSSGRIVLP